MKRFANTICATAGSKAMTIIVVRTAKGLAKQISLTSLASAAIPGALGICTKASPCGRKEKVTPHAVRTEFLASSQRIKARALGSSPLFMSKRCQSASFQGPLPRVFADSAALVIPRNVPPPVAVSVTIAIIIVLSIIIVDAPPPVSIVFTMICALNSICLRDHAQLLADL